MRDPEQALHEHAGAGEVQVGRQRRVDDQVDVVRREARALDRFLAAFAPSSAPPSPGSTQWRCSMPVRSMIHSLRGLHHLREIVVRDDAAGDGHADAQDAAAVSHARSITTITVRDMNILLVRHGETAVESRRSLPGPHGYSAVRDRPSPGARTRRTPRGHSDRDRRTRRRCRARRTPPKRSSPAARRRCSSTPASSKSRTASGRASSRATSRSRTPRCSACGARSPGRDSPAGPGAETLGDVEARAWAVLEQLCARARPR